MNLWSERPIAQAAVSFQSADGRTDTQTVTRDAADHHTVDVR